MTDIGTKLRRSLRRKPKVVNQTVNNTFEVILPVRIQPGDTLIVQCERRVSRDVFLKLQQQIKERLGDHVGVIVLEAGLHVEAVVEGEVR